MARPLHGGVSEPAKARHHRLDDAPASLKVSVTDGGNGNV